MQEKCLRVEGCPLQKLCPLKGEGSAWSSDMRFEERY